jgi:hypothetical protein
MFYGDRVGGPKAERLRPRAVSVRISAVRPGEHNPWARVEIAFRAGCVRSVAVGKSIILRCADDASGDHSSPPDDVCSRVEGQWEAGMEG